MKTTKKILNDELQNYREFDDEVYEKIEQARKQKGRPIEEFMAEMEEKYHFSELTDDDNDDEFANYDLEFPPEVYEKIEKGLQDIKEGRCRPIEEYVAEMKERYRIYGTI